MKITVWGINYSPELVGIGVYNTDLCEFLASAGHEITMVTGFPYYPVWRKRKEDAYCLYRKENKAGVNVWRCWQYVPANPTVPGRIMHEASFVLTSVLKMAMLPRADVYVVVGPPMLLGVAAWIISIIKQAPCIYHVQDLQPDAAVSLGMLKRGWLVEFLFALQRLAYQKSERVSSISQRMCEIIWSNGAEAEKILLLPNWVEVPIPAELPEPGTWKKQHGIDPSRPIVSYAGNLGIKQGLDLVIEAASLLQKTDPTLFVIAGNGGNESIYKKHCAEQGLQNVLFQDVLSKEDHTALLVDSDICLIPQKAGTSLSFLPSKLLKILALGRPVLTNADENSALHDSIAEGKFGISVKPGDAQALARAIVDLLADEESRRNFGEAGRRYVAQFERATVLAHFEDTLRDLSVKYASKKR